MLKLLSKGGGGAYCCYVDTRTMLPLLGLFLVACHDAQVNVWISKLITTGLSVAANTILELAPFTTFLVGGWLRGPLASDARPGRLQKFCMSGLSDVWQQLAASFLYYLVLALVIVWNAAPEGDGSTSNIS